ncbi:hypothetical protein MJG53_013116 [Ovis ammon polii x Ovis aries]|uniref:Uncharacterized protein n=1 Tax=Ovis ammon polii x Ovis aries TaxID=2918886 RepID=A0ACB9UHH7_9CETA|nr:hypothetical protein MJG53_013116 [Ovis ammon polii x Ovis aries]
MSQTLLPFLRRACHSDGFLGARADEQQPPYRQSGGSCRAIEAGTRASVAFTCGSESACEYRGHAAVGGLAVRKGDPVTNGSVRLSILRTYYVPGTAQRSEGPQPIASPSEESGPGTSLVVQRIRICLPVQETRVRSLAEEEPTCLGATKKNPKYSNGRLGSDYKQSPQKNYERERREFSSGSVVKTLTPSTSESTKLAFPTAANTPPGDSEMLEVSPEVFSEILAPSSPSKKLISESSDSLAKNAEPLMFQKIVGGSSQERQQRDLENGPEWNKAASGMAGKELPAADSGMTMHVNLPAAHTKSQRGSAPRGA